MKVLMIGWELPPYNSGGLGVACLGLAKSLSAKGVDVTFVLPKSGNYNYDFMKLVFADVSEVSKLKTSYTSSLLTRDFFKLDEPALDYISAAFSFAEKIRKIVQKLDCDLIHAHDWLAFPAGLAAKEILKKPLIVHVHSTEFDRTGGHSPNPHVYQIEKKGLEKADRVVAISALVKSVVENNYGISEEKIRIVHNGVDKLERDRLPLVLEPLKKLGYKIVLFLGRITLQKGPEYFVRAAEKVSRLNKKVIFIVVGSGDMQEAMMNEAVHLGIMDKMIFTGFLRGEEKHRVWQSADVYVMPSVSEPFGLTALESISNKTPVIISKQSGVSEVLSHALKVDFWDVDELANKISAVINYSPLVKDLVRESSKEIKGITWDISADKCINVYNNLGK